MYLDTKALNGNGISDIVNRCARASAVFCTFTSEPVIKATDMYIKSLKDCEPAGVVNYTRRQVR